MALDAGWDEELLRVEIEELEGLDFDLGLTGFDESELADLFGDNNTDGVEDDDFDLSDALEKAAFVEKGDVWTVGRHNLMCGDATSKEDVDKLMDGKKANLIMTDSPYGVAFQNMAEHLEKGGVAYVFHADTEGLNFRKAFVDAGFHLSGCCIWVKNSLVLGRRDYQWQHEPVLYGFLQNGKHYWSKNAGRSQTTIWNFDEPKKNENHPTSKPLYLLAYPIGNSSQENTIVIDTFGGSGSTLMSCEKTSRICHTMELDEKYASVILRRYVEDTGDEDGVFVIRDGKKIQYKYLVKEVETHGEKTK